MVPVLHHRITGGILRSWATHTWRCWYFGTMRCAFCPPPSMLHVSKITVDLDTPPKFELQSSQAASQKNSPYSQVPFMVLPQGAAHLGRSLQKTSAALQHHKGRPFLPAQIFSRTRVGRRGGRHFSATAAAMGARMVPRAVAASSSISALSRLITHSMASRPWSRGSRISPSESWEDEAPMKEPN